MEEEMFLSSTGFLLETKLFAVANMKTTFMFICSGVSTRVVLVVDVVVVERKRPCARAEEFR